MTQAIANGREREPHYCVPADAKPQWIIRFDDAGADDVYFDTEVEARVYYDRVRISWTCYLFAPALASSPLPASPDERAEVQRFVLDPYSRCLEPDPNGPWVRYDDIAHLLKPLPASLVAASEKATQTKRCIVENLLDPNDRQLEGYRGVLFRPSPAALRGEEERTEPLCGCGEKRGHAGWVLCAENCLSGILGFPQANGPERCSVCSSVLPHHWQSTCPSYEAVAAQAQPKGPSMIQIVRPTVDELWDSLQDFLYSQRRGECGQDSPEGLDHAQFCVMALRPRKSPAAPPSTTPPKLPPRPKTRKITPSGSAFANEYYDPQPVDAYISALEAQVREGEQLADDARLVLGMFKSGHNPTESQLHKLEGSLYPFGARLAALKAKQGE